MRAFLVFSEGRDFVTYINSENKGDIAAIKLVLFSIELYFVINII
jgi:hypothetical protein